MDAVKSTLRGASMTTKDKTTQWYQDEQGWSLINNWLTALVGKGADSVYIGNFGIIPDYVSNSKLILLFDRDCDEWKMVDDDGDLQIIRATGKKRAQCS